MAGRYVQSRFKKKLPYIPTKEEVLKLLSKITDIKLAMVIFMSIFHGLRISEIVKLKWKDVNLEQGEIFIQDAKNTKRFRIEYGQDRIVPINDMFIQVWKKWKYMTNSEYVLERKKTETSDKSVLKH